MNSAVAPIGHVDLLPFVLYALIVVALLAVVLGMSWLFGARTEPGFATNEPFESGIGSVSTIRPSVCFYLVAISFVVFDLDAHAEAWKRIVDFVHRDTPSKIGIQLGHAGRKGSTRLSWEGDNQPLEEGGWPIVMYTLLGGAAAVWYVGPPIRWVYRGLGETVIGLSYGPWMVLGSLHLHTHQFSWGALLASLVPGLLIMSLATVNNIPDFHQDRLVGKKNLVVRLGRKNGRILYLGLSALGLLIIPIGIVLGLFPKLTILAALAGLPLWTMSLRAGAKTWDTPRLFMPAIRSIVQCYALTTALFAVFAAVGR